MSQLISDINLAITNGNTTQLIILLDKLPLKFSSIEVNDKLLESFLTIAFLNGHRKCLKIIFDRWARDNIEENTFSTPVYFATFCGDLDVLRFVIESLNKQPLEYFFELINNDSSPENYEACKKITRVIPLKDETFWRSLLKYIDDQYIEMDQGNYIIREFIVGELEYVSSFMSKPSWMKDFGLKLSDIKYDKRVIFELPSAKDAAKLTIVMQDS